MLFEVINPSEPYTMEAADLEVAAVAVSLLGRGQYGLSEIGGDVSVPVLALGGHDQWFLEQFGRPFEVSLDHITSDRMGDLILALDSLVIGDEDDRKAFLESLVEVDSADREAYRAVWHNPRRSSMNDIGSYGWGMAKFFREQAASQAAVS